MACDRFADQIRGAALGAPLRADAAAHLAVCSDCQARLETETRVLATIDIALQELATTGPAPDFVSRVRAYVERASRWTPSVFWRPAAVVALVLLIAAAVTSRLPRERSTVDGAAVERPVEIPVAAPAEKAGDPSLETTRREPTRMARVRRQLPPGPAHRAQPPEVLVPQDQRAAVGRLFASLRAGRPEVISMLMRLHGREAGADSQGLTIEPLRIEPLVVSALPSSASIGGQMKEWP